MQGSSIGEGEETDDGFTLSTPQEFRQGRHRVTFDVTPRRQALSTLAEENTDVLRWGEDLPLPDSEAQLLASLPLAMAERFIAKLRSIQRQTEESERRAVELESNLPNSTQRRSCLLCFTTVSVLILLVVLSVVFHSQVGSSQHCLDPVVADREARVELDAVPLVLDFAASATVSSRPCPITPEKACLQAFKDVEAENVELQAGLRQDMDGYRQMVTSMTDWVGIAQSQASSGWCPVERCVKMAQDRYNHGVAKLNASLFQSHAAKAETQANAQALRKVRLDALFEKSDAV